MEHIKLEDLDVDGALRETAEAAGVDRSEFLKKGLLGGAGLVAGGAFLAGFPSSAAAQISTRRKSLANDIKIGNFALTLEYLEAEFYAAARRNKPFRTPDYEVFASTVGDHEAAHVRALRQVLGSRAVSKPRFDFGDTVTDPAKFQATAQALEDAGVAAYAGQGPNLKTRSIVRAALSIHSVEARHAAWIRFLNFGGQASPGNRPAPRSFDAVAGEKRTLQLVQETGFIQS